jgi:OmpA-OmpF porin, OOP family
LYVKRILSMTIRSRLLGAAALVALLAPVAAQADTHDGFFLGAGIGAALETDSDFENSTTTNTVELSTGFAGLIMGGYQFSNNWRVQAEFAMRTNDVDSISGTGAAAPFEGDVKTYSLMADAIYGIPTGTKFTPYVGAGVGVAWVNADGVETVLGTTVDDSDTVLAYQGIAGVEYDMTDNLKADLGYRYFRTADATFTPATGADVDADIESHTLTLGLRYLIPAPQPMPEPAPAPVVEQAEAPAQPSVPNNYIVFFDFDSSRLTPEAERIISAAATNAQQARATTLEVAGHSDRSGNARYNMRLSQRRADIVRKALESQGITSDQVAVVAKGEAEPLVATADGVREAQNRRVQVVLK